MKVSERWLRHYANPTMTGETLAHTLTMAGLEVETTLPVAPPFSMVVVGHVLEVSRHPNADKLSLCQVDVGLAQPLQIVCGAPNVEAGMKAPCALPGARLPGGLDIAVARMRGVESHGMLCSARELGLSDDHGGLLRLEPFLVPGTDLREALELDDTVWELKLTPNLAHCMSVIGIAREVSALTGAPLTLPTWQPVAPQIADRLPVRIESPELCGRFSGRVIRRVNARAATPAWMKARLERAGQRSISALVDISNYVMLEWGRPTHVFDLGRIQGGLTVRWGREGESLELLNGMTVSVGPDADGLPVGVIADERAVESLAGIMGGAQAAVDLDTQDIYLEAAFWWPASIAGRARRYRFSTDAAQRFERGVDPSTTVAHIEYLTQLILEICGGQAGPIDDQSPRVPAIRRVTMRLARARRVIGVDVSLADCLQIFERLGMTVEVDHGQSAEGAEAVIHVQPPAYRFDLEIEEDLIEEVVRVWGYERLPLRAVQGRLSSRPVPQARRSVSTLKRMWVDRDWQEVVNFAFVSGRTVACLAGVEVPDAATVRLLNPISETLDVLRDSLWPGLLGNLRHNQNRKADRVRIIEVGRVFSRQPGRPGGALEVPGIAQPLHLGGLAWGSAMEEQWGQSTRSVDFFDVKADIEATAGDRRLRCVRAEHPALHPGQSARILDDEGVAIGWLGTLHPRLMRALDLSGMPPVMFELTLSAMLDQSVAVFQEFSRFPPVVRDLAFIVDEALPVARLLAEIDRIRQSGAFPVPLQSVKLFDEYRGKGLENKEKSLAFRFWMQDTRRTLEDSEADAAMKVIAAHLGASCGARLRAV